MSLLPYEIGTCLFCRKCMFCGKNLTITTCNCKKSIKPSKKNRTTEVKFYRNCSYILDNNDLYAQKVQESVIKYNYNIFLNKTFNYTLCSSCNRSEEHTSELQSRGLISYAVFCLKKRRYQLTISTCNSTMVRRAAS